ncbi:hypothetical protein ACT18O_005306 [Escherichia coli]|nr:hypothetical protein [Escherichia coli]
MHNDQHNYDLCLQAINERVKSECLLLLPQEHDAVKSIQAEPYGHLTPVTLGIIARAFAYFHERRSLNNFHRDRVITFEQIAE